MRKKRRTEKRVTQPGQIHPLLDGAQEWVLESGVRSK